MNIRCKFQKCLLDLPGSRICGAYLILLACFIAIPCSALGGLPPTYLQWLVQNSLPADGSGLGAVRASPAADGIGNGMKFGLGLNPWQSGFGGRFVVGTVTDAGSNYLAITYQRPFPLLAGVAYDVELSSNLAAWSGAIAQNVGVLTGGLQTVAARFTPAMGTGAAQGFMRLRVTLADSPAITSQPASQSAATGDNVIFTVAATGDPTPAYQWQKDGTNLAGATLTSLILTNVTPANAGGYTVMVSNPAATVTSLVALLTIVGPTKPGATNTGWTGPLTSATGGNLTVAGTVLENLDIAGTVYVKASNVTIRNCRITAGSFYAIQCTFGFTGLLIEDCELTDASSAMIYGGDFTARRLNIHHGGADGIKTTHDVLVERCWIHHLGMIPTAHADGVQARDGGANFIFRHNNFDLPVGLAGFVSNSAFILQSVGGQLTNAIIDSNWLNGGNYTVYGADMAGVTVTNNQFGRGYQYGLRSGVLDQSWIDNVWEDDGTPVP